MNKDAQQELHTRRQQLADLDSYPWNSIEVWVSAIRPLIAEHFTAQLGDFAKVTTPPRWASTIAWQDGESSRTPRRSTDAEIEATKNENRRQAETAKARILTFVDALLVLSSAVELDEPEAPPEVIPAPPPAVVQSAPDALIDFAILTAIEVERKAVCEVFGLASEHRVRKGSRVYWRGQLVLGTGEVYELVVAQAPDAASVDAAILTNDLLHHWHPDAALLIGIAASTDPKKIRLGDVVVGSEVYYYERGKVTADGTNPEPKILPADATLWGNITAAPDWNGDVSVERPDATENKATVHQGVIASGEKVIADARARDLIASGHRKTVVIEMEGYGFSRAVWQSFDHVRHLVIRGVCDDGSSSKDDRWHRYAAMAASSFTRHFLLDRPLEPRNAPRKIMLPSNAPPIATPDPSGRSEIAAKWPLRTTIAVTAVGALAVGVVAVFGGIAGQGAVAISLAVLASPAVRSGGLGRLFGPVTTAPSNAAGARHPTIGVVAPVVVGATAMLTAYALFVENPCVSELMRLRLRMLFIGGVATFVYQVLTRLIKSEIGRVSAAAAISLAWLMLGPRYPFDLIHDHDEVCSYKGVLLSMSASNGQSRTAPIDDAGVNLLGTDCVVHTDPQGNFSFRTCPSQEVRRLEDVRITVATGRDTVCSEIGLYSPPRVTVVKLDPETCLVSKGEWATLDIPDTKIDERIAFAPVETAAAMSAPAWAASGHTSSRDGGVSDSGVDDAGAEDAGSSDAGPSDAGRRHRDGGIALGKCSPLGSISNWTDPGYHEDPARLKIAAELCRELSRYEGGFAGELDPNVTYQLSTHAETGGYGDVYCRCDGLEFPVHVRPSPPRSRQP